MDLKKSQLSVPSMASSPLQAHYLWCSYVHCTQWGSRLWLGRVLLLLGASATINQSK